jgi:hypothetical protein
MGGVNIPPVTIAKKVAVPKKIVKASNGLVPINISEEAKKRIDKMKLPGDSYRTTIDFILDTLDDTIEGVEEMEAQRRVDQLASA